MKQNKELTIQRQTHILYVFVIELVVQGFFDRLLLFGDFVKSRYLHSSNDHLERKETNTQNFKLYHLWRLLAFLLQKLPLKLMLQIRYFCFFKQTYRFFPLHELAFCKLLIWYKLKPEYPRVTAMPEEDTQ